MGLFDWLWPDKLKSKDTLQKELEQINIDLQVLQERYKYLERQEPKELKQRPEKHKEIRAKFMQDKIITNKEIIKIQQRIARLKGLLKK